MKSMWKYLIYFCWALVLWVKTFLVVCYYLDFGQPHTQLSLSLIPITGIFPFLGSIFNTLVLSLRSLSSNYLCWIVFHSEAMLFILRASALCQETHYDAMDSFGSLYSWLLELALSPPLQIGICRQTACPKVGCSTFITPGLWTYSDPRLSLGSSLSFVPQL